MNVPELPRIATPEQTTSEALRNRAELQRALTLLAAQRNGKAAMSGNGKAGEAGRP